MKKSIFELFKNEKLFSVKKSNYFDVYENFFSKFRDKDIVFLEIGVADGGSLSFFRDYFSPNSKIIGFDSNPGAKVFEKNNIKIFVGDQASDKDWHNFFLKFGKLDIVLDDGGHTNKQQIITFENCFHNLNDNGLLVFEDTESSYIKNFGNPSPYSFVNYAKKCVDTLYRDQNSVKSTKHPLLSKNLYSIHFFDSIIAFEKNSKKAITYDYIDNRGEHLEGVTEKRNKMSLVNNYYNFRDLLIKYFPPILVLRKIFNFKFMTNLIFKIENFKLRKYFKNFELK